MSPRQVYDPVCDVLTHGSIQILKPISRQSMQNQ